MYETQNFENTKLKFVIVTTYRISQEYIENSKLRNRLITFKTLHFTPVL